MPGSVQQRFATGAKLLLSAQIAKGASQLVGVLVLSRLLDPAVFGVAAVAAVIVGLGELLRDAGLTTAAIREPEITPRERSGLFWLNLILGAVLALVTWIIATPIVEVMGASVSPLVIQSLSFVFLINGFSAQYRADSLRIMKFGPVAAGDAVGAASGLAVAVVIALLTSSVWALVAQIIVASLVACGIVVASRWSLPQSPTSIGAVGRFLRFGLGVSGAQALGYLSSNVDVVSMTLRTSPVVLGLYNRAFQVVMAPSSMIQLPLQNSVVPAMGHLRADPQSLERLVRQAQAAIGLLVLPLLAWLAAGVSTLVPLALGPGWTGSIDPTFWLCGAAALQTLTAPASWSMISEGRSGRLLAYSAVALIVRIVMIFPVAADGAISVAIGYFLSTLILWPVATWWGFAGSPIRGSSILLRSALFFIPFLLSASLGRLLSEKVDHPVGSIAIAASVTVVVYGMTLISKGNRYVLRVTIRSALRRGSRE